MTIPDLPTFPLAVLTRSHVAARYEPRLGELEDIALQTRVAALMNPHKPSFALAAEEAEALAAGVRRDYELMLKQARPDPPQPAEKPAEANGRAAPAERAEVASRG